MSFPACVIRFAAVGVKPGDVERWMLYAVTAWSSNDGCHISPIAPTAAVAVRFPGAVGAIVSSHAAGKRTKDATDGTPFVSTMNSM